jgi:hypothetical protein
LTIASKSAIISIEIEKEVLAMSKNVMMTKVIYQFGFEHPNTIEFSKILESSNMAKIYASFEEIMARPIFEEEED